MTKEQEKLFLSFFNNLHRFMIQKQWFGACHAITAMLYAFAKKIGIDSIPCIGKCEQEGYPPFDHSWLSIDGKIYDLAIAMPFNLDMAKGPVIASIDSRTNMIVEMDYGISYCGLDEQALMAYNNNIYDYLCGWPNPKLINAIIDLAKNSQIYITGKWLEQNLSNDYFILKEEGYKDLFETWLHKESKSYWIKRALTDNSYKTEYQRIHHEEYSGDVNTDLATYGDAVIKLCYLELMLDKTTLLTIDKSKVESDKFLVDVIARHYSLIGYIHKDSQDSNLPNDYNYENYQSENRNRAKYIATCVEAIIGAIYKEINDLKPIIELLDSWRNIDE